MISEAAGRGRKRTCGGLGGEKADGGRPKYIASVASLAQAEDCLKQAGEKIGIIKTEAFDGWLFLRAEDLPWRDGRISARLRKGCRCAVCKNNGGNEAERRCE